MSQRATAGIRLTGALHGSRARCRPGVAAGGELDLRQTGDLMRFTIAVNFCGLPALSVPVGHSAQGGVWRGLVKGMLCQQDERKLCH